jgi:GNAT superfamily N-acetyltransferase
MRCDSRMETLDYTIRLARPDDVPLLREIELAAARLFVGYAPESLLTEALSQDVLANGQRRGLLWIAVAGDKPVGFALVEVIEQESAHLEEMDVHPDHMRRGLGSKLVNTICEWAATQGYKSVTLNTSRDIAWNMPFYERLGFAELVPSEWSTELRSVFAAETLRGLDPTRRLVMRREVG